MWQNLESSWLGKCVASTEVPFFSNLYRHPPKSPIFPRHWLVISKYKHRRSDEQRGTWQIAHWLFLNSIRYFLASFDGAVHIQSDD
jgi:hypothetical protein